MSIVVTGATGHLGHLVVESLLTAGVPAPEIVAGGRNLAVVQDLAARGVVVRSLDYSDPESIVAAVAGAEKVLIVSGTEMGRRVGQHTAVARAALDAGATSIAYTSAPHADTTSLRLADEHRGTEEAIRALGAPFTFLRNGWYFENYTSRLPVYLDQGAVVGAAGDGRISGADRADYAAAAAAVLTTDGHEGAIYELGGDTSFTLAELAAVVSESSGREIAYQGVSVPELTAILTGAGIPAPVAEVLADSDRSIHEGELFVDTGDLSRLIGRPTGRLRPAVAAALQALSRI